MTVVWFFVRRIEKGINKIEKAIEHVDGERKQIEEKEKLLDDLKRETEELARKEAKDEALLNSIGEGIVVTDSKGLVELINQRAEEMVGWRLSEVVGKRWFEIAPLVDENGDMIPPEKRATQKVLATGQTISNDKYFYIRRDGTKFPVWTTAAPVFFNNKITGVIAVFRNIQREREVENAKSEFVSLASHQLRTPLSAIKWFAEMLINGDAGELNSAQLEYVDNIAKSNERMIDLVNSLLNISRIESGRIIIDPSMTDLVALVKDVIAEMQSTINDKHIKLVFDAPGNLSPVMLDPKLIRHVYMNLLTNAVKYTRDGGEVVVFISKKGDELVSQVSDNGYGIPEEDKARIFQKFFRATNIAKIETNGTGLGLYLVKTVIESSGGRIWFESIENKGTTFWFTLPMSGVKAKTGTVSLSG